jgi:hypothetical protein
LIISDNQDETCLIITINDTSLGYLPLIINISDACKNKPKRFDFDNTVNLSSLIVILGSEVWCGTGSCLNSSCLADTGVVKNMKCRVASLVKKKIAVGERPFLFLSGTNLPLFQRFFFFRWWAWNLLNLKGCVFVYVPHVAGHKISVKGALGVGGGGKECLKTYTSLGTRDSIVL